MNLLRKKSTNINPKNKNILETSQKKIKEGLSKETASTGTPIEDLHGGAKFLAQLSNIGGGSKETGGGGIKDGFNTITAYVDAKAKVQSQPQSLPARNQTKCINKHK